MLLITDKIIKEIGIRYPKKFSKALPEEYPKGIKFNGELIKAEPTEKELKGIVDKVLAWVMKMPKYKMGSEIPENTLEVSFWLKYNKDTLLSHPLLKDLHSRI